jgi:hypothetical protein
MLKERIREACVLAFPHFEKVFRTECDVSRVLALLSMNSISIIIYEQEILCILFGTLFCYKSIKALVRLLATKRIFVEYGPSRCEIYRYF